MLSALLVAPTRLGPRVARSTWPQTIAVLLLVLALLNVAWGSVIILLAGEGHLHAWFAGEVPHFDSFVWKLDDEEASTWKTLAGRLTLSERISLPFAAFISDVYANTEDVFNMAAWLVLWIALFVAFGLAALVLMPTVARSLSFGRRLARSAKLCVWASICTVPAMAAAVTIVGLGETWLARWDEITYAECFAAVGASALLWWTSLVVRLGSRSPAAEIAADARHVRPRCHHCGYTITGLPVRGGCPECGSEVAPFLPDNRLAPAWKERKRVGRLRAFWRTIRAVVCDREFFRRLAIHRGAADALSFAFAASLAAAALCLVAAAVALVPHVADWEGATRVVVDSLVAGGLVAALVFWPMLSVVSIVSRACRRSPTAVLIAGCYATALAIPAAGVLSIAVLTPRIGIWAIMTRMTYRNVGGPLIGEGHFDILDILDFRIFASSLLVLAAVVFAAYRAVRGMREVRFAGW